MQGVGSREGGGGGEREGGLRIEASRELDV
jgi:hypothetical protein